MLHNKSARLMSPSEYTQLIAAEALNHVARMQTTPTGTIVTHNADGTKTITGSVLGTDSTGTSVTTATHVGDTTPPGVPTGITAWSGDGTVHVAWDGTLTGGIPADFDHVTLLANGAAFAALTSAGSATCKAVTVGATVSVTATSEDDVCAIDGTPAHNVSAPCAAVSVVVTDTASATDQHFWADADGAHVSSTGDHDLTGANLLLTSAKLAFRNALTELFSIVVSGTSAVISFLGGKFEFAYKANSSGVDNATISSSDGILVTSEASTTAECLHTLTTAEGNKGFLPAGTRIHSCANVSPYDDKLGACAEVMLDCTQPDGSENQMLISLLSGCRLNGTTNEPTVNLSMSTKDGSAAATSYAAQMPFRRFLTAIQPVVLYNGGAALDYDTAPGAGTTGTVTLSETAANFRELTVFYHYGVWACSSVTLTNPNGKTAGLYLMFVGADGNLWIKTRNIAMGGTSITNATKAANLAFSLKDGACLIAQSYDAPEIAIDRVEGRR